MGSPFVIGAAAFYLVLSALGMAWLSYGGYDYGVLLPPSDNILPHSMVGILTGALLLIAWRLAEKYLPAAQRLSQELAEALPTIGSAGVAALAATSAVGEEIFFRGAMQSALGPIVSTIIFGVLHGLFDRRFILWMVFATLAGAIFAAATQITGNILAATIAHALVNGVNLRRLMQEFG